MGSISKRLAQEKQATRHSGWSSTSPAPTVNRKNRTRLVTALLSGRQLRLREVESLPRVTQQGSRQDRPSSPGCLSVCLSACQSPPSCGQQPGPLSLLPSLGGRSDHIHRAAGPPPRAPARGRPGREEPLLCVQCSQQMPELGGAGRPRALFSLPSTPCGGTQQAAWLCRIYLSTWELKKLAHSVPAPGSSAGGSFTAASRGPGRTETQPESRPGRARGSAAPCSESCCGILV